MEQASLPMFYLDTQKVVPFHVINELLLNNGLNHN
jgi:hypothetical protein